jgi:hypothetical protein
MTCRSAIAAVVLLAIALASCMSGQRYINVSIDRDGTRILEAGYGVSDALDARAIWNTLQEAHFESSAAIEPDAADPLKAALRGKIRIVIRHVQNQIASTQVDELRLIRASNTSEQWLLAPGEANRTARAPGQ